MNPRNAFDLLVHLGSDVAEALQLLASALSLAEDLHGIVTYDDQLADSARSHGVQVTAPG